MNSLCLAGHGTELPISGLSLFLNKVINLTVYTVQTFEQCAHLKLTLFLYWENGLNILMTHPELHRFLSNQMLSGKRYHLQLISKLWFIAVMYLKHMGYLKMLLPYVLPRFLETNLMTFNFTWVYISCWNVERTY